MEWGVGGCREYRSGQAVATHLTPDVGYAQRELELENFNTQAGREGVGGDRERDWGGGGGGREGERGDGGGGGTGVVVVGGVCVCVG